MKPPVQIGWQRISQWFEVYTHSGPGAMAVLESPAAQAVVTELLPCRQAELLMNEFVRLSSLQEVQFSLGFQHECGNAGGKDRSDSAKHCFYKPFSILHTLRCELACLTLSV